MNEIISSESYTRAVELTAQIETHISAINSNLFDMCRCLKEIHDGKLYKELGYTDFENYTEGRFGFKRRQAYSYLSIASNLPDDLVKSISRIGTTKLSLIATLSVEQQETLTNNLDLSESTVKELKAEIEKLKADSTAKDSEIERQKDLRRQLFERSKNLMTEKVNLERRVDELEKKPAEIAVQDNSEEIEKLNSQINDLKKQLAEKPAVQEALPSSADSKEIFKAYLTYSVDAFSRLIDFVNKRSGDPNYDLFIDKALAAVDMTKSQLTNLKGE